MNTLKKIAVACGSGAFLGSLIGIQFHHVWIGVLVGAILGYVIYEFKEIPAAMKRVWSKMPEKETISDVVHTLGMILGVMILVGVVFSVGMVGILGGTMIGLKSVCCTFELYYSLISGHYLEFAHECMVYSVNPYPYLIGGTLFMYAVALVVYAFKKHEGDAREGKFYACAWMAFAPGVLPVLVPFSLFALIIGAVYGIYKAAPFIWKLAVGTFRLIHSDMRLLCMADAALGAFVGYYCNNPLIGGIVGAVLGVVNYEIVSVRWLKLAPKMIRM